MSKAIKAWHALAATALCAALSVSAAQADNKVTFRDALKPDGKERSKAEKIADGDACGASGAAHTINVTMPVFEKCMNAKGWVLDHYSGDPAVKVEGTLTSYTDTRGDADGHPRENAAFKADERACKAHHSGNIDKCLADSGWERILTQHGPVRRRPANNVPPPVPTWIDPETGLTCHNEGTIATICSNY
jgi:hypothetical protein